MRSSVVAMFACFGVFGVMGVGQAGYKLVEWPAPATSAAGFAWPGIRFRRRVSPSTRAAPCSCCTAAPIRCSSSTAPGKLLRSWGDGLISEGKVAGIPKENFAPDHFADLGRVWTSGMHVVWRTFRPCRSARQHLDRRRDRARVVDDPGRKRDHAAWDEGHVRRKPVNIQPADRHWLCRQWRPLRDRRVRWCPCREILARRKLPVGVGEAWNRTG